MYQDFFAFSEPPFSIVPNSRHLFLSQRHKEAIQHLEAGLGEGGGFALLTGEVGTGKTTVAKVMLANLGSSTQAGLILNPTFSDLELLEAICDEFSVEYPHASTLKQLNQVIYQFLLNNHAKGIQTLLVIDEAQHLAADVLEQLRLLTNLETETQKLLKVLLIGQPELQDKLKMPQLRQLAQRITGRYHLLPLTTSESVKYVQFRLEKSGGHRDLFPINGLKTIASQTQGIPRLINLVCDSALRTAYQAGVKQPNRALIQNACNEVMQFQTSFVKPLNKKPSLPKWRITLSLCLGVAVSMALYSGVSSKVKERVLTYLNEQNLQNVSVAVQPIEQEVFAFELKSKLLQSDSLEQSLGDLYEVWGYQSSVMDRLCENETNSQRLFHCQHQQGTWQDVVELNLPVVVQLDIELKKRYAVLHHVDNNVVELLFNGNRIQFDKKWLESIWTGEYHYIWQPVYHQVLRKGMSGAPIAQLDERLSTLIGEPSSDSAIFDEQLERKVKLFQRWQGMDVDGIAGQRTLKTLALLTQDDAPKLLQPSHESKPQSPPLAEQIEGVK
ncbi:ExeA family protein [uncultured Vibrio sp.]|uniref:ExeA family protein n=1 Tax=uncultured Vibrio sp. TaxID=114054 RepID=UPI0009185D8F|nr:ExeA family protein [uncultured Vibrio sp.]OIQ23382.1 MAG: general secretion pathway protein GspA [Vibrio sp. MedPE-SWchi]